MSATSILPPPLELTAAERAAAWRRRAMVAGLILLTAAAALVSICFGAFVIGPDRIIATALGQGTLFEQRIVVDFRLPRIIVAICVGSSLAVSGTLLQAVTRNPLASPAVVGVNSGAGLGALIVLSYVQGAAVGWATPLAAFIGAIVTGSTVFLLSRKDGVINSGRLALIGVAIGGLATAGIQLVLVLTVFRGDIQVALRWLIGSLWNRSWDNVVQVVPWTLVLIPVAWLLSDQLDLLGLGEDVPRALGSRLEAVKLLVVALAIGLAASAVAVAGTIAFVGLLAPHMCRRLVGPGHWHLLPVAAAAGALLVLVADMLGRAAIPPLEIPAGLFTALIGAPYFLVQLRRGLGRS